jgi:alpha-1,3-mannosyltransferase
LLQPRCGWGFRQRHGTTSADLTLNHGSESRPKGYRTVSQQDQAIAVLPADASLDSVGILSHEAVQSQLHAILDGDALGLHSRLECPVPDSSRYHYLRVSEESNRDAIRYFVALSLRECLPLLPTLLGGIIETIRFLGPKHCALSIVEGNSPDGTAEVLAALQENLGDWTNTHFILNNSINPLEKDRFPTLAKLRNMALAPVFKNPDRYLNATILFINDVAICAEDPLELFHQRVLQEADMTCAMDWIVATGSRTRIQCCVRRIWAHNISFFVSRPRDVAYPGSGQAQSLLRLCSG